MTEQPSQEYIITEEELNSLPHVPMSKAIKILEEIRSRPAPAADAPKTCLSCNVPNVNNGKCCLDETNCMDIAEWEKKNNHDAAIRQQGYKQGAKDERERVLDKLIERANDVSETAEMPCDDGWHTGEHPTGVIRISYLEREAESLHSSTTAKERDTP